MYRSQWEWLNLHIHKQLFWVAKHVKCIHLLLIKKISLHFLFASARMHFVSKKEALKAAKLNSSYCALFVYAKRAPNAVPSWPIRNGRQKDVVNAFIWILVAGIGHDVDMLSLKTLSRRDRPNIILKLYKMQWVCLLRFVTWYKGPALFVFS